MSQSYPDGSDIPALPEAAKMKRSTNMEQRVVHMTVHGLFQEASGKGMVGKHRGELEEWVGQLSVSCTTSVYTQAAVAHEPTL